MFLHIYIDKPHKMGVIRDLCSVLWYEWWPGNTFTYSVIFWIFELAFFFQHILSISPPLNYKKQLYKKLRIVL